MAKKRKGKDAQPDTEFFGLDPSEVKFVEIGGKLEMVVSLSGAVKLALGAPNRAAGEAIIQSFRDRGFLPNEE